MDMQSLVEDLVTGERRTVKGVWPVGTNLVLDLSVWRVVQSPVLLPPTADEGKVRQGGVSGLPHPPAPRQPAGAGKQPPLPGTAPTVRQGNRPTDGQQGRDAPEGLDWVRADDGKWYPPGAVPPTSSPPPQPRPPSTFDDFAALGAAAQKTGEAAEASRVARVERESAERLAAQRDAISRSLSAQQRHGVSPKMIVVGAVPHRVWMIASRSDDLGHTTDYAADSSLRVYHRPSPLRHGRARWERCKPGRGPGLEAIARYLGANGYA